MTGPVSEPGTGVYFDFIGLDMAIALHCIALLYILVVLYSMVFKSQRTNIEKAGSEYQVIQTGKK